MPPRPLFLPGDHQLGTPEFRPPLPRRGPLFQIGGVTRDSAAAVLPSCAVHLFRTATDVEVEQVVSDGSGVYLFPNVTPQDQHYAVAYLPGSPDVAGTTVNTLVGILA